MLFGKINPKRIAVFERTIKITVFLTVTGHKTEPSIFGQIRINSISFVIETI